jgi:hypothetical protein
MMFLIVAAWDADNHPTRVNCTGSEAEARALVDRLKDRFPEAFHALMPAVGSEPYWIADPVAKTVTLDQAGWFARPFPADPLTAEELFGMLKAEGIDLTARWPRPEFRPIASAQVRVK